MNIKSGSEGGSQSSYVLHSPTGGKRKYKRTKTR